MAIYVGKRSQQKLAYKLLRYSTAYVCEQCMFPYPSLAVLSPFEALCVCIHPFHMRLTVSSNNSGHGSRDDVTIYVLKTASKTGVC